MRIRLTVAALLAIHCGLLAYSAAQYSPTLDEPAHLVAGLWAWKSGSLALYRVNPPLVKLVAALPVLAAGYREDPSLSEIALNDRPEFVLGRRFLDQNGERSIFLIKLARWACIPFCVLGGLVCYCWAKELYGPTAGILSCSLWVFSPSLLGHGALITADAHASALGLTAAYTFWTWLRSPTWIRAAASGITLGLALLAKSTLLVFLPLWPALWFTGLLCRRHGISLRAYFQEVAMLAAILILSLYCVHFGYGFTGSIPSASANDFRSAPFRKAFDVSANHRRMAISTNHLHSFILRTISLTLPRDYTLGIDTQLLDFEIPSPIPSYLAGHFQSHGWWYFYLYAMLVKTPIGVLILATLAGAMTVNRLIKKGEEQGAWHDDLVLLAPTILIVVVVSSKTGFSKHSRYVLPCLPFLLVWLGQLAPRLRPCRSSTSPEVAPNASPRIGILSRRQGMLGQLGVTCLAGWAIMSSLAAYPHSLSYFNELAGGVAGGPAHLIGSDVDWGQDLLELKRWQKAAPGREPLFLAFYGDLDPRRLGIHCVPIVLSHLPTKELVLQPGWYAISVSLLQGMPWYSIPLANGAMTYYPLCALTPFQQLTPYSRVGGSILVYRVDTETRLFPQSNAARRPSSVDQFD